MIGLSQLKLTRKLKHVSILREIKATILASLAAHQRNRLMLLICLPSVPRWDIYFNRKVNQRKISGLELVAKKVCYVKPKSD